MRILVIVWMILSSVKTLATSLFMMHGVRIWSPLLAVMTFLIEWSQVSVYCKSLCKVEDEEEKFVNT